VGVGVRVDARRDRHRLREVAAVVGRGDRLNRLAVGADQLAEAVRQLSPNLRSLFINLGKLQDASIKGYPALRGTLNGLTPVLDQLDPFLANLNPILRYLQFQKGSVVDFLMAPGVALSGQYVGQPGDPAPRHGLRQLGYVGQEALSIYPSRLPTNRGNAYLPPGALNSYGSAKNGIFANFDCKNTDYAPGAPASSQPTDEQQILPGQSVPGVNGGNPPGTTPQQFAPCWVQGDFPGVNGDSFGNGRNPTLFSDP
jgi:hypothetical protein